MVLDKKAVAEIIAALLMITITISCFVVFYLYSVGLFGQLQGAQVQQSYSDTITLEFYDWTNPATLKIEVRNVGSTNIVIRAIYIAANNITAITWGTPPNTCTGGNLPVQATCLIQLPAPGGLTAGTSYSVVLATSRGALVRLTATVGQIG